MEDIENNKPKVIKKEFKDYLEIVLIFYKDGKKYDDCIWGTKDIVYEVNYYYKTGEMQILKQNELKDYILIGRYRDRRGRGITFEEMQENIEEFEKMSLKDFKKLFDREEIK